MMRRYKNTIYLIVRNYCKISLNFWVELNAKIKDTKISYGDFYDGKSFERVQPFADYQGYFLVNELVENYRNATGDESVFNGKELTFSVNFYYSKGDKKPKKPNFSADYYYDFSRDLIALGKI